MMPLNVFVRRIRRRTIKRLKVFFFPFLQIVSVCALGGESLLRVGFGRFVCVKILSKAKRKRIVVVVGVRIV